MFFGIYKLLFFSIKSSRLLEIAQICAKCFHEDHVSEEDKIALFYFPFQKQTEYNLRINAGGCMYNHYHYERKVLIKLKIISEDEKDSFGKLHIKFENYLIEAITHVF